MVAAEIRRVDVVVNESTSDDEIGALASLFTEAGLTASIEASYPDDGHERASWLDSRGWAGDTGEAGRFESPKGGFWIALLYGDPAGLASELGPRDLKDIIERLRKLRADHNDTSPVDGAIFLVDEATGIRLMMEHQLPDRAYELLPGLVFSSFHADPLRFDRTAGPSGNWRSPAEVSGTG